MSDSFITNILKANATIRAAENARYQAKTAAEHAYKETTAPCYELFKNLKATYAETAQLLAEANGKAPHGPWGGTLTPDAVVIDVEGITLTWDINGDSAPHYYTADWEAISTYEPQGA